MKFFETPQAAFPAVTIAILALLAGCPGESTTDAAVTPAVATSTFDAAAELASLDAAGSADGQAWYQLAVNARVAGDNQTAATALARAEALAFSVPRVSFEKMRQAIANGKPEEAEAVFQAVADSGFTAVQLFTGDPVINSLAGREKYDQIVAAMSLLAYPCLADEKFREFDFWVGDWEVHASNGQLAGTNTITVAERGCALIENWENAGGGTGMSINYLDKATDEWVQIWNAEGGSQINIRGGMTAEGMRLVGTLHTVGSGTTLPFRALWTPLPDGRVRQFFEQSTDNGVTWQPWFEGFYTRTEVTD